MASGTILSDRRHNQKQSINIFAAPKHRGDVSGAVVAFDRLLAKYPAGLDAESAFVERMRLLRATASGRAIATARQYLARYPTGFARTEAETIVAGLP